MKKFACIFFFLLLNFPAFSFHLVGGEMIYNDLGNGNYQIVLKIYRDCAASNASDFDGIPNYPVAYITVYDAANSLEGIYDIGAPVVTPVPPAFNNPCILAPNSICIQEGVYTYTLNLPPKAGGYTVVYQRCCRNSIIENLVSPDAQGATYFARIPGPEDVSANNSPRFSKFPPIYICRDVALKFDHSAVDPDGDQLVYSLCSPYAGLDACCPSLNYPVSSGPLCVSPPVFCPLAASSPPYSNVLFLSPYNGAYPIDSNPAFSINPVTGELSGTPTLTGQYVVGVCVQEFRNNKLLNTHFRDFQFTVIGCTVTTISAIADQEQQCQGNTITFSNQSTNNSSTPFYHWDFGVPNLSSDTSNLLNPTYMYPDTGIYVVTLITNPGKPCTDTLKKKVYVYPPLSVYYKRPGNQCLRNNAFNFTTEGIYLPQTTYLWEFDTTAVPATSTLKNPQGVHFTEAGLFFIKLKAKQFACQDSFIDSVRIIPRPKARINNLQKSICAPALVGFSNGSSSVLPLNYYWQFSNGNTSADFEPHQIFSPAGTYAATLIVETRELCRDTSVAILSGIQVLPKPVAEFTFSPKEASIFDAYISIQGVANEAALTTTFSFGDGHTSNVFENTHVYSDYGTYAITQIVMNDVGCRDTLSGVVKILPEFRFWMPNSFTPDNNGQNDVFIPVTIGISQYQFEIYNRWGERIFETNNPKEGWNGNYKGKECQQGIYVWKLSFKNVISEQTEQHAGHVNLFRNP